MDMMQRMERMRPPQEPRDAPPERTRPPNGLGSDVGRDPRRQRAVEHEEGGRLHDDPEPGADRGEPAAPPHEPADDGDRDAGGDEPRLDPAEERELAGERRGAVVVAQPQPAPRARREREV